MLQEDVQLVQVQVAHWLLWCFAVFVLVAAAVPLVLARRQPLVNFAKTKQPARVSLGFVTVGHYMVLPQVAFDVAVQEVLAVV